MQMIELALDNTIRIVTEPGHVWQVTRVMPLDRATRLQEISVRNTDGLSAERTMTVQVIEPLTGVWPVRAILRSEP